MKILSFSKPNIIIVDDHLIFRQGLRAMMTAEKIANIVGEASNGVEFLKLLKVSKPDLVLMDIDMPQMDGMEATLKAIEIQPDLKIIALTMFGDEEYYYRMIELGVKGFILKSAGIVELERAIKEVMKGKSYFSNELLQRIIQNFSINNKEVKKHVNELSGRETEVLGYICQGMTTDEIAQTLHLSPRTIKSHRANILEKTACRNTPTLILYALKNKIIKL